MQTATSIQPSARIALTGKVTCRGQTSSAAVVDLGSNSITLRLSYDIKATEGQAVSIDSTELGRLNGLVQWARGDRIQVGLSLSSNTAAKFASYHKYFR